MVEEKDEIFICDCYSVEHQLILRQDPDSFDDIYVYIHLNKERKFWKRLKHGVKYIFGYKSRFGAWDEFIVNKKDWSRLRDIIDDTTERHIRTSEPLKEGKTKGNVKKSDQMGRLAPPPPPLTRLIREGTIGDCPICKSTTIKKFMGFGKPIGCIQEECENYYKRK